MGTDFNIINKCFGTLSEIEDWTELENVLDAQNRVTPIRIEKLRENEVFVFGSDIRGKHDGRASKVALTFGAVEGKGEGLYGNTYAIPTTQPIAATKDGIDREVRSIEDINESIITFINTAKENPDRKFLVTRIGAGFAGHAADDIAKCFKEALKLKNVYLPQQYIEKLFEVNTPEFPLSWVPSSYSDVTHFRSALANLLQKYLSWLYGINPRSENGNNKGWTKNIKTAVCDRVETISQGILNAIDQTFAGFPASAYKQIETVMNEIQKANKEKGIEFCKLEFTTVKENHAFYRIRVENDNWVKRNVNKEGMFHIPFFMRDKVKTQRYSMPGYPCLYLGEHVYSCWEELGRPNLSNCLVSKLVNKKEFKVLDLSIPKQDQWRIEQKDFITRAILFPLVIACTFKGASKDASFKPEYIIPQLLLQYVKANSTVENNTKDIVYGIKYTSVNIPNERHDNKNWNYDTNYYTNYVIPVSDISNKYCSKLCKLFQITEPVCEEYESLIYTNTKRQGYNSTRMGQIEELVNSKNSEEIKPQ